MTQVSGTIGAIGMTGAYAVFGIPATGTCSHCGCPGYHAINCPETKPDAGSSPYRADQIGEQP